MFDILFHSDLDVNSVAKTFPKTLKNLQDGDFKSADVRKMSGTDFYRARLDIRDRLLFNFVTYNDRKYILLLEVIKEHNYARSRFLRGGAVVDEERFTPVLSTDASISESSTELRYLHPEIKTVHTLNKFISFDLQQQDVYALHPPLIIVGSAGSGKTALVLEKLKELPGNVAYISLSKYLVDNASFLYYSYGYDNASQEAEFLSLNDYLSLWRKPEGREIDFPLFERWFMRHQQALRIHEPYRVFEEFKGVITGAPVHTAWLSVDEYMSLGVKQSIFGLSERERLYPLFLKYLEWMKSESLYDGNIHCYEHIPLIRQCYDYVMVDEVQDMTNIQLRSILTSLRNPANFIFAGDSNQIVHPNFFSWSKIKTYFYNSGEAKDSTIQILHANYRNSSKIVELSNNLLKIKNSRFGSIDRETNYLINPIQHDSGEILLYADDDNIKLELNRRTQDSTKFAVIVPDRLQKAKAALFFKTPLVFSVHEVKGLEYENVILIDFVSYHEAEFREIISGVSSDDLKLDDLRYNRASSKHDKDAEVYKFYINSFYVAITRAIKNIYIFEQCVDHPALALLQMQENRLGIQVSESKSSKEEWLDEARRLEEQGKYEQAEQIRAKYLGYEYISRDEIEQIRERALDPLLTEAEVRRERKQLFQYAINHRCYEWIDALAKLQLQRAVAYMKELRTDRREYEKNIRVGNKSHIQRVISKYGVDFTNDDNTTGLMLALSYGQSSIADQFLSQGASIRLTDKSNLTAFDYLLNNFLTNKNNKQRPQYYINDKALIRYWDKVRPLEIKYEFRQRIFSIGSHSMLFVLILLIRNTIDTPLNSTAIPGAYVANDASSFSLDALEKLIEMFPDEILPPYRKKRSYLSSIMSAHELSKDSHYGKATFMRVKRGLYKINPEIVFC
ncbi:MAG: UvrD-helicase domain-containing protein [Tannerellaceae bacterium]|jgi:DUF2075 family protein|nr:UvrD-helicase domain-containing protein [Tannerellaceae bacterium]